MNKEEIKEKINKTLQKIKSDRNLYESEKNYLLNLFQIQLELMKE